MPSHPVRVSSIDILRALTMLLMIFVNDLWTLKGIPGWLEHTAAEADDMGLADTVFPAFLFIVGMSIPLSIEQRRQRGENTARIAWHILERGFALLVMGLFLVNGENLNESATGISRMWWFTLNCASFILLWAQWPREGSRILKIMVRLTGAFTLAGLAWLCRGGDGHDSFATYWWGILGLIGWAYLATALVYLLSGNRHWINIAAWFAFIMLCIASHAGWIPTDSTIRKFIAPFGEGSMPAFTMGGTLATLAMLHFQKQQKIIMMLFTLLGLAVLLFLAGVWLRQFWGISKIRATPAWVLICSGITLATFVAIYWLADIKGKAGLFRIISPAGTNTLLCYLLPYFAYALAGSMAIYLPAVLLTGLPGLLKSVIFSLLIIIIAGGLGKMGLKLKL